uniref:Uncharacterized protein n=1 Tax=Anopheles coluzzii TaxID=1518534 RepID=A0A8W7NZT8_ANOCL
MPTSRRRLRRSVREEVFREYCTNSSIHGYLNNTDEDVVGMLKNLSLSRHGTLGLCQYCNQYMLCGEHLKETLTEEGFCYTFNMMPEEDIFRKSSLQTDYTYTESWFPFSEHETLTPLYARGAGLHAGLTLFLRQIKEDVDYMCTGFSQGYKLMIHDPGEYPQVSMRNMRIPFGHEISIALKPQMMITSQSAADFSWEKRQCFFNHERHLRYFKIYNQENCELECLTNVTQAMCGSISYDVETTQTTLDLEKFLRVNHEYDRSDKFYITTIAIYFKESYFITSKRSELDIHFPAITICPETKVHAKKLNFTAEMEALLKDYNDNNGTSDRES